jgi:hypothetical protein
MLCRNYKPYSITIVACTDTETHRHVRVYKKVKVYTIFDAGDCRHAQSHEMTGHDTRSNVCIAASRHSTAASQQHHSTAQHTSTAQHVSLLDFDLLAARQLHLQQRGGQRGVQSRGGGREGAAGGVDERAWRE